MTNKIADISVAPPVSMLDFYTANAISPVHQDISDLAAHFDRRRSLYRCLGLLTTAFRGRRVLEVGPGSGHNSLFIASLHPERYDLVEGNPVAGREIVALYDGLAVPHTRPNLTVTRFEDFTTDLRYDVCISEGWLGSAPEEQAMVAKLAGFVAPEGVLVVTTISPVGLVANMLRRALGLRVAGPGQPLAERTARLVEAFGPHLATMRHMTRLYADWVQDNLISPHYYGICLTPRMVVDRIGDRFEHYSASPRLVSDWRWYKMLQGSEKRFNEQFLEAFESVSHNLLDHRQVLPPRAAGENASLEAAAWGLLEATRDFELERDGALRRVHAAATGIGALVQPILPDVAAALIEGAALLEAPAPTVADIAGMRALAPVFGRELIYLSFQRLG